MKKILALFAVLVIVVSITTTEQKSSVVTEKAMFTVIENAADMEIYGITAANSVMIVEGTFTAQNDGTQKKATTDYDTGQKKTALRDVFNNMNYNAARVTMTAETFAFACAGVNHNITVEKNAEFNTEQQAEAYFDTGQTAVMMKDLEGATNSATITTFVTAVNSLNANLTC